MAAKKGVKKAAAKKAGPKRKTGGKRAAAVGKAEADAEKSPPVSQPAKAEKAKKKGTVSSMKVNASHVFSLRPRVSTSYRQADFRTARQLLQDEDYADIEEATRAVVEKALEMTREGPSKRSFKPRR